MRAVDESLRTAYRGSNPVVRYASTVGVVLVLAMLCAFARVDAVSVSDCPGQGAGGMYDQVASSFTMGAISDGVAIGEGIFLTYFTLRFLLLLAEGALAVADGGSIKAVWGKVLPSIIPMLVGFSFLQSFPVLVPYLLEWAPQWGVHVGGADTSSLLSSTGGNLTVTPSSAFGTFNCLSLAVASAAYSGGPLSEIANFLPSYFTQIGLDITGALIATSLLCVQVEADIVIPLGAPTLGLLAGPDGKHIAMGYLTKFCGIIFKIAACSAVLSKALVLAQGWAALLSGPVNVSLYAEMMGTCVMLVLVAWLIPLIAASFGGAPAAMTTMAIVSLVNQARSSIPRVNGRSDEGSKDKAGGGRDSNGKDGTASKNEVYGRAMP